MSVMPPRRLALLVSTLAASLLVTALVYSSSDATARRWPGPVWGFGGGNGGVSQQAEDLAGADARVLRGMKVESPFEYRRVCFDVKPTKGLRRTLLDELPVELLPEVGVEMSVDGALPPCDGSINLDVPSFDPWARTDTSHLMLGMATMLKRVEASLPAMARWLPNTGTPLLVLLVDQLNLTTSATQIEDVRTHAAELGMELIFEPYQGNLDDSEGLKNFALSGALQKNIREDTEWFGIIDDDTFFLSLPAVVENLAAYDHNKKYYIGALTEAWPRVQKEGFKAWGGAGFFISPPLMAQLADSADACKGLDQGFGDLLWRDCILDITSPPVPLTQMPGLNQMDIWGDISGWYESGHAPLHTVHHWKSWHFFDVPLASTVSDIAGHESFLQRYLFDDDVVLTNGFSIAAYPNGLPDLNRTELIFAEEVSVSPHYDRMMYHYSLGDTRPAMKLGVDKLQWTFVHAEREGGRVRQFYLQRRNMEVAGSIDSLIEVDWQPR